MPSQDYFMRQIEAITDLMSMAFLGDKMSDDCTDKIYDYQTSAQGHSLLLDLRLLLALGEVNQAENLLFESLDEDEGMAFLEVAHQFYAWLDEMSDEALFQCSFSRDEIREGLCDVKRFYEKSGFFLSDTVE